MSSKKITIVLGTTLIAIFAFIGYSDAVRTWQNLQAEKIEVETLQIQHEELNQELDQTIETKEKSREEVKKLEQEKQKLEEERKRLEAELQAKRESEARLAQAQERERLAQASSRVINTATFTQTASAAPVSSGGGPRSNCGDNQYAAYIYGRESGGRVTGNCDTTARNAGGCLGIGQACPGSKIAHCGSDYTCQNNWFTQYAMDRYGSWAAAFSFHKANGWW